MIKDCVACLAQLAERKTEDLEVAGSTPAAGIKFFFFTKEAANITLAIGCCAPSPK